MKKEFCTISVLKSGVGFDVETLEELSRLSEEGWEIEHVDDNFILLGKVIKKKNAK